MLLRLQREKVGLWVMDVQERLFPRIERCCDLLETLSFVLKAAKLFELPITVSEQNPAGLGTTIEPIQKLLPTGQPIYSKTTFSGYADPALRKCIDKLASSHWILVGIEAHICILQTAKDLIGAGKKVIILNDAISSRSLYDYSTAIGELRDIGARISSAETLFYELIQDSTSPLFKEFISLVKQNAHV